MAGERKKNRYVETRVGTEKGRDTSSSTKELRAQQSKLYWGSAAASYVDKDKSEELRERERSVLDQLHKKELAEYRARQKNDVNKHKFKGAM